MNRIVISLYNYLSGSNYSLVEEEFQDDEPDIESLKYNRPRPVNHFMSHIPLEIIREITSYLSKYDTRRLAYSCKSTLEILRSINVIHFTLNKRNSLKYCLNTSKIRHDLQYGQLSSIYLGYSKEVESLECFQSRKVTSFYLVGCPNIKDISPLASSNTVYIDDCQRISNVDALCNVKHLTLKFLPKIVNLSRLGNHESVELCGLSPRQGFEVFSKVKSLHLNQISSITDETLTHYKDVKKIELLYLSNITSVESLANASEVTLISCKLIRDISPLDRVKTLHVEGCYNIENYGNYQPISIYLEILKRVRFNLITLFIILLFFVILILTRKDFNEDGDGGGRLIEQ